MQRNSTFMRCKIGKYASFSKCSIRIPLFTELHRTLQEKLHININSCVLLYINVFKIKNAEY